MLVDVVAITNVINEETEKQWNLNVKEGGFQTIGLPNSSSEVLVLFNSPASFM